jgi:hypothetical protein
MPPENDNNNMNVEDEQPLLDGDEGVVISGGQPLLLRPSSNGIIHDDDEEDESPLAMEIVAENDIGRIIASPGSEQIPVVAMAATTATDSSLDDESPVFYSSSRDINQVSSTVSVRDGAFENSPEAAAVAASLMRDTVDEEEDEEEEKREIEQDEKEEEIPPTFAVIPPYFSTPTEQAIVLGEPDYSSYPWRQQHQAAAAAAAEDDDAELTAMKRMAAAASTAAATYGGEGWGSVDTAAGKNNDSSTTSLEPLDGEDAVAFYKRNRNFWTINAAEFLVSQEEAALASVENLKVQGMNLAKDYFDAAKREQSAAGVVAVAAARNATSDQQSSCNINYATAAGSRTLFELGPLVGETNTSFLDRTHHFWTMQAAESLARQDAAAPFCVDALNLESARLAQEYWAISQNQVLEHHHHHAITNDLTQHGTIVEITDEHDLHPLEMSLDAVQAEFVGQDFTHRSTSIAALSTESLTRTTIAVQGLAVDAGASAHVDDMTTEATVIDSAPLAKEESQEAWREAEEAHVLEERVSSTTPFLDDRKPAAVDRSALDGHTEEFAVAEQEAEVLAIQEDIHPFEFVDEHDAQAHVVGQDYSYESISAVIADEHVSPATQDNVVNVATSEEGQGTEFHAVASRVGYSDNGQAAEVRAVASPASSHEQNQAIDAHAVVSPATTDQGGETPQVHALCSPRSLSTELEQTRQVHAVVVEQTPPTPTATPVSTVSNPFEDDPNDTLAMSRDGLAALDAQYDDSWMRAPSLASQDLPPVAVLASSDYSAAWLEDASDNTHGDDYTANPPPRSSSATDADENLDAIQRTSSGSSEPTHSNRLNQLHHVSYFTS